MEGRSWHQVSSSVASSLVSVSHWMWSHWKGHWAPWVCLIPMPIVKVTDVYGHTHLFMWVLGIQTQVPVCSTGLLPTEPPPQHGQMLTALESLLVCTHLSKSAQNTILGPDGTNSSLHRQLCNNGKPHQRRFWTALSNDSIQTPFLKARGAWDWHWSDEAGLFVGLLGGSGAEERRILAQILKSH